MNAASEPGQTTSASHCAAVAGGQVIVGGAKLVTVMICSQ
jgi:hypothetical protein